MSLNENQARHVAVTFAHVDSLLEQVERLTRDELSPFARERPDLSSEESRLIRSAVTLVRARMLAALQRLQLPRPEATTSARWGVETSFTFADIALSELGPANLRGFGAVDAGASAELAALVSDLRGLIVRARTTLHENDPGGLAERLAAIPGSAGEVLRALAALSADHGLAAVRPLIAVGAERALATTLDVGIFGRVSAGKSSLINALVGDGVLPVGTTPATAVPIWIRGGGPPRAIVRLLDGSAREIALADIDSFATERGNPQNQRGVRAIELTVSSVAPGLRYLDTPGVGSLGTSGPAQSFAWLPRCDLGLVLVAAGGAIGREEIALVSGLRNAGIACHVLLSKSDLVSSVERAAAVAYVERELDTVLGEGHGIAVHPVSTFAGFSDQLDALRHDLLEPLAADHEQAARTALAARLRRLVAATAAAMASGRDGAPSGDIVMSNALRERALGRIREEVDALAFATVGVLDESAAAVVEAWRRGEDASTAARAAVVVAAGRALAAVRAAIDAVVPDDGRVATARRIPPLFDPEFLDALPPLTPPRIPRALMRRSQAARRLAPITQPLETALTRYASRLLAWGAAAVDESAGEGAAISNVTGESLPGELARLDALVDAVEPRARPA